MKTSHESEYEEVGPGSSLVARAQALSTIENKNCDLCGCNVAALACDSCTGQLFCSSCDFMFHKHPKRASHVRKVKNQYIFFFTWR